MPGPGIHISVMRHVAKALAESGYRPTRSERVDPRWTGPDPLELGRIMRAHDNFAALGAHGPDLFFLLPDFRDIGGIRVSSVLTIVLEFIEGLYDALDPYISKWEHYLGPISEDTAEEISRLTGGLSETLGDIAGELSGILITALEDFVTGQADLWEFFSLGLNKGYDDQAFFWSDIGHYRRTGAFARALWEHANGDMADDRLRAYALGYMTHVGADTTAHSFVNSICGGPFRTHWQRHHLVENHMDALWYLQDDLGPRSGDQYPQFTESALYYDLAFADDGAVVPRPSYPTGDTLRENWERARKLDIDSDLPDSIADLLLKALDDLYYRPGGSHPKILDGDGRPTREQIAEAYRLWIRLLKLVTVDGFSHEPPPPPDVFPNLDFPTPSDPSDSPPDDGDDSWWEDLLDFILSVIAVIAYILEVIAYLATLPWAVLADLITYPFRLALYYALELPLFHMLKAFRSVLVMTGYLHPMEDEIRLGLVRVGDQDSVNVSAVNTDINDVFGGVTPPEVGRVLFRDPAYPYSHPGDEFRHPWDYPDPKVPTERCPTTAGPWARLDGPDALFADAGQDPSVRDGLESADGPLAADTVGLSVSPQNNLGDPVAFCKYVMWLTTRDPKQKGRRNPEIVDWNLDADRGYGYHDWDWNRDPNLPTVNDPEGNPFLQPCTWPPQADSPPVPYDPNVPLKLHWTGPGLQDPGCDVDTTCAGEGPIILRRRPRPGRGSPAQPRPPAQRPASRARRRSGDRRARGSS
jgi:zinc dependent phospholipase C